MERVEQSGGVRKSIFDVHLRGQVAVRPMRSNPCNIAT